MKYIASKVKKLSKKLGMSEAYTSFHMELFGGKITLFLHFLEFKLFHRLFWAKIATNLSFSYPY